MTGRAAAIQGGLAVAGLLAAHFTWQREPEHAPGSVTVIDAGKSDIGRIHYEDDDSAVDLTRGHGGSDPAVWIHLVAKKPVTPIRNPHEKAPATADKPTIPPPRDLPGSEAAAKLYDQFAPFVSPRAFGVLDKTKLKELGLDAPKKSLDVTVKGDVRKYEIGQPPTSAAVGESFLRDARDGRVYLMPRAMSTDLLNAAHLVDRRLHAFEPTDFRRFVVTAGGKQKELVRIGTDPRGNAGFAPAKTPDKPDQMAKNWQDSIWRLFPNEVLGRDEEPSGGKPKVVARIDYYDGKDRVGWLELARLEPTDHMSEGKGPSAADDAANGEIFARSEHTAGWAKVGSSANQLITDAQKLVSSP